MVRSSPNLAKGCVKRRCYFRKRLLVPQGGAGASSASLRNLQSTVAEATEEVHNFRFGLNSAVTFRKWLRYPRGDLEPPRAMPSGVSSLSLLPRWSLRHLLQSTARSHQKLYVFSFSVASPWRTWSLRLLL